MNPSLYWVYILYCDNHTYYSGYTTDLVRRFQEHVSGSVKCKYTRSFKPLGFAQCWQVSGSLSLAMQVERYIKKMTKKEKIEVIHAPSLLTHQFGVAIQPIGDLKLYSNLPCV